MSCRFNHTKLKERFTQVRTTTRTLNEEIKRASALLYHRIRQHDNPIIAALRNYDIHMHYSYIGQKQILHNRLRQATSDTLVNSSSFQQEQHQNGQTIVAKPNSPEWPMLPSTNHNPAEPSQLICLPPAFTLVSCSAYSTLKIDAICSSETSVNFQRTTRCHIP
jgi:hypothetical protein